MQNRNPFPCGTTLALFLVLLTGCFLALPSAAQDGAAQAGTVQVGAALALVDIDEIGPQRLASLRAEPGIDWWVEVEDRLLVLANDEALAAIGQAFGIERVQGSNPSSLYFVRRGHTRSLAEAGLRVLAHGGRWAVVSVPEGEPLPSLDDHHHGPHAASAPAEPAALAAAAPFPSGVHAALVQFQPNVVLARQAANDPQLVRWHNAAAPEADDPIAALVAEIDDQRWFDDVSTLASWNRYTRGSEIDDARDWLIDQFEAMPGLMVSTQSFSVNGTQAENVIGTLVGTTRPDDWYVVGAHYDSISQNSSVAAPGAEDNASGCAGVLEMARALTRFRPEATVIFLCFSGEEQGLFGGSAHASKLVSDGDAAKVKAVLNMDMIGYTGDADLDCLLESNASNSGLIQQFAAAAAQYTSLRIVTSFFPFGSDHVPYLNRGMPALLTIENDWDSYPGYHRTSDLPANLSLAMGGETLRMNIATLAQLAGAAGSTEIFADGFESGDTSNWLPPK